MVTVGPMLQLQARRVTLCFLPWYCRFQLKKDKEVCTNPQAAWVQDLQAALQQK